MYNIYKILLSSIYMVNRRKIHREKCFFIFIFKKLIVLFFFLECYVMYYIGMYRGSIERLSCDSHVNCQT